MSIPQRNSWKSVGAVVLGALVTLVLIDLAFWKVKPPRQLRQVEDAMVDLRRGNPDVLVLSSSHGRTFHVLGRELERRTDGKVRLVAVPLESGHMSAMNWVLANRVGPLIDRQEPLPSELIFGITWWDSCRNRNEKLPEVDANVVSRAWAANDYAANVARDGLTDLNRNYASYRWQQLMSFSSIVPLRGVALKQDMSFARFAAAAKRPDNTSNPPTAAESAFLMKWRREMESGPDCIFTPQEMQALGDVVKFAEQRRMMLTVVLFPLKPATITELGRRVTLEPFAREIRALGQRSGFRVVDMTDVPVIGDDDFMADFDHVTPEGNRKFADWALAHELEFLLNVKRPHAIARQP